MRVHTLRWALAHAGRPPHERCAYPSSSCQATQFRKVCRSKNSNGRPIPPVKWRTIVLVKHYIKILYRLPCVAVTSLPPVGPRPLSFHRPVVLRVRFSHTPAREDPPPTDPYIVRSLRSIHRTHGRVYVHAAVMRTVIGASWPKYKMTECVFTSGNEPEKRQTSRRVVRRKILRCEWCVAFSNNNSVRCK